MTRNTTSNIDPAEGGGPWTIDPSEKIGDMTPGDIVAYTLRSYEFRGRKGYFKPWLPLDAVQITNKSPANPVQVTINGQYEVEVPPNSTRGYSDTGILTLQIENMGSTTIISGELKIEVSAERYDADEQAYNEYKEPAAISIAKGLIGL